jgi:hypothetical protein
MPSKQQKEGAPIGNQNGLKLKDPEIRQFAYSQYCEHLAKGKSKKSWYFDHPQLRCTWETMEKYLVDEVEFDPIHKRIAEAKGFAYWEGVIEGSATGKNKHANTASLQMLMRNKYGWDKLKDKEPPIADAEQLKKFEMLMEQISNGQIVATEQTSNRFPSNIL